MSITELIRPDETQAMTAVKPRMVLPRRGIWFTSLTWGAAGGAVLGVLLAWPATNLQVVPDAKPNITITTRATVTNPLSKVTIPAQADTKTRPTHTTKRAVVTQRTQQAVQATTTSAPTPKATTTPQATQTPTVVPTRTGCVDPLVPDPATGKCVPPPAP